MAPAEASYLGYPRREANIDGCQKGCAYSREIRTTKIHFSSNRENRTQGIGEECPQGRFTA